MRKYEMTFIFQPQEDVYSKVKNSLTEDIKKHELTVEKEDDMGVRDLAYEVENQKKGHYVFYLITADPAKIKDFERTVRLKQGILKYLFVKLEE
ncbi:MAG: 30S ribosomal protein S6 [Spirochaetia bacterium]